MKKRNTFIIIIIVALFIVSIFRVFASSTRLYVDPQYFIDPDLKVGDTFTVNVNVADVVDLYGYDFKLRYDPKILNALNVTSISFFPQGSLFCAERVIDNSAGYIWIACVPLNEETGVSGSGTLETITFQVVRKGETTLHLFKTELGNKGLESIAHELQDGFFSTKKSAVTTTTTTLPSECKPRGVVCNCNGICDKKETSETCPWDCF